MSRFRSGARLGDRILGTVTTALAITAIGGLVGVGHSMYVPIKLTLVVEPAVAVQTDETQVGEAPLEGAGPLDGVSADVVVDSGKAEIDQAIALFEQGVQFLDARNEDEYFAGHVAGAVWMTSSRLTGGDGVFVLEDLVGLDSTLAIYCTGGDCDASENAAIILQDLGYSDLVIIRSSFEELRDAGLPVEEGAGL